MEIFKIVILNIILITVNKYKHCECKTRNKDERRRHLSAEYKCSDFSKLANKHGIHVEKFDVVTEDEYVLTIFHVVPEKKLTKDLPVLLQHGILDSADTFLLRGNKSLTATLMRAGHDVWVGNTRGNKYGRRHLKLDPDKDKSFWNYTLHEIGVFDTAAMIDFVLNRTEKDKINVIGHSQGNAIFYILGTIRLEYNRKINVLVALAPVAYLNHVRPPFSYLIALADIINQFFLIVGQEELLGENSTLKNLVFMACYNKQPKLSYNLCVQGIMSALFGSNIQREFDLLPSIIQHVPQSCARKQLLHWAQIGQRKIFAQFDYGPDTNMLQYKAKIPPAYDLRKVTMNIALYVSKDDTISTLKDIGSLRRKLPNVIEYVVMKPWNWNHVDWIWASDMETYFYPHILKLLGSHV